MNRPKNYVRHLRKTSVAILKTTESARWLTAANSNLDTNKEIVLTTAEKSHSNINLAY